MRRVVEAAPGLGIATLTLYAFSSDNWRRPPSEVANLMGLLERFLHEQRSRCAAEGVRLEVVGRRDRLRPSLRKAISATERATAGGSVLRLRIAVDYASRDVLVRAAAGAPEDLSREEFARRIASAMFPGSTGEPAPDVDLLIRTGGEQRLSDFLLWECAYAELSFSSRLWPDFGREDLEAAVADFKRRERRFGALPTARAV